MSFAPAAAAASMIIRSMFVRYHDVDSRQRRHAVDRELAVHRVPAHRPAAELGVPVGHLPDQPPQGGEERLHCGGADLDSLMARLFVQ
jgi:hypothetical protein